MISQGGFLFLGVFDKFKNKHHTLFTQEEVFEYQSLINKINRKYKTRFSACACHKDKTIPKIERLLHGN